jgi:hypothetical protein
MTSGRTVALAVLLTPLGAFAQQSSALQSTDSRNARDTETKRQVEIAEVSPGVLNPATAGPSFLPPMQIPNENVCFTMRTYVMARDTKDSDSTHLVRYSTCTPSNNRGVKKVAGAATDH